MTLKGEVRSGKVDCQAHYETCQSAGITAYPTVRFYAYRGSRRVRLGEHINSRDANTIADIIRSRLEQLSPRLHSTPKVTSPGLAIRGSAGQNQHISACLFCRMSSDTGGAPF
uniref:Thioredoxin domain-containing protein n=1 Tax=Cyprinodon variegatus TaxID=28743 RepID=A0A3Q2DDV8_CYPVA